MVFLKRVMIEVRDPHGKLDIRKKNYSTTMGICKSELNGNKRKRTNMETYKTCKRLIGLARKKSKHQHNEDS